MNKRPFSISHSDQQAFEQAMQEVKPLNRSKKVMPSNKVVQHHQQPCIQGATPQATYKEMPLTLSNPSASKQLSAQSVLFYARAGIQRQRLKQLKRGNCTIQKQLDLHGMTVKEAHKTLLDFLQQAHNNALRTVLVIHGKGYHSPSGNAILKNHVDHWLRQLPTVLAFTSAQPKDGGYGAVYVLLRSNR